MNYWIFQSDSPDLKEGKEMAWDATRYRNDMQPGDLVYIWVDGESADGGIHGWGEMTSDSYEEEGKHYVKVEVKDTLKHIVPAKEMHANSDLQGLLIMKAPVGTNFLISPDEAREISELIAPDERPKV